ncbi:MAG: hypothetical protein JWQ71_4870 [Pedosphaera sp.]|nr:hypothetical protein [Pedosphaera sp.]
MEISTKDVLLYGMLHRREEEGITMISQPAHAWVSGQLARHWGNKTFGDFAPKSEVCQAAALHDIGFLDWEQSPTLNPETGLPYTFLELPTSTHLHIWSRGIEQMLRYGRYSALLVSMHFTGLCQRHPSSSKEDRQLEQNFLAEQEDLQTTLTTSLQNDFYYEPYSSEEIIGRNRQLVSLWDWLSLLLCMGFTEERTVDQVPKASGLTQIKLKPTQGESTRITVEPWPFREKTIPINVEGRQLLQSYSDENKMRAGIQAASPVTLKFDLVP